MPQPTFDVAASDHNAKAPDYFTLEDDGLAQDWPCGVLWCNPPFGNELVDWLKKATDELASTIDLGHQEIWFLIPARVDVKWFHEWVWEYAEYVFFLKGRVNFLEHGECKKANATFPNMLVKFSGAHGNRSWWQEAPIVGTLEPPVETRGRGQK